MDSHHHIPDAYKSPRRPTQAEIDELKQYLGAPLGDPEAVDRSFIAVFDHYANEQGDYVGKVLSIVWGSTPGHFDNYIWRDGSIEWLEKEC